jgi:hypothetical protein
MKHPVRFVVTLFGSALLYCAGVGQGWATNAWHIPDNAEIDANAGVGSPNIVHMRDPWIEISNNPASPTTVTIYQGIQKWTNNGGTQIANQIGGTLYYKGLSQNVWQSTSLGFHENLQSQNNQYWKASFSTAGIAANDPIQYYIFVSTDGSNGNGSGFIYAPSGLGDHGGAFVSGSDSTGDPGKATAATSPFTIRNRPGWIFHANNRVNSGSDVQFWAKVGYIGDVNNLGTRWATNGALYYTTDGTDPVPGTSPGSSGSAATQVATFLYDHPDNNNGQNGGSTSIAGTAMWWVATGPGLLSTPLGTTIKYKVGFWNSSNSEQKFGDYNAGDGGNYQGHIFSFTNGTVGDPVLTVNGVNANYTTTHVFIDETKGDSIPFTAVFQPGQPNITAVEVYTNLNRRDKATVAYTDANGISTEEGIEPIDGSTVVAGDDSHYFKAYTMTADGNPGEYALTLPATKTGAYRLTARWKVQGDNNWRYYTNIAAGRRDHAIVVSPVDARKINLYEINVFNVESDGIGGTDDFAHRSTLEDLFDAPNAPHNDPNKPLGSRWNLTYLKNLGCNWLWFQPIHPITQEAQEGHDPGSPYSVRSFFDIDPLMSVNYNTNTGVNDPNNRAAALAAFQGLVSAANNAGVGIMLDAPFNHSAPDCEVTSQGTSLFGNNPSPTALFRDVEARFYSRDPDGPSGSQPPDYAMRAFSSTSIALAPDRGDFGKWPDVRDIYFGRYAALVDTNGDGGTPDDNGNYLNEQDWFDYSIGNESSSGSGNGHFDAVTQNVWKYFSNYTLYWLSQTGVPAGTDLATQTTHGIGALRADFGQGLPPQLWEYIINKTRTRKWNFVFMAESLDGGAVTYRSNRHFDILNENIVFPLKNASGTSDFRGIFDARRSEYGQGLVLLNNMSHDEEAYQDPWFAVIRYAVCSTIDGVPLIFPGQELGISTTFGYDKYEVNFGKNIADFKDFNSMMPAWNDTNFGNDQLYPVYAGIGQARLFSPALRSSNRYYLNQMDNSIQPSLFSVAKYETAGGSPATTDVVFGFVNLNRDADQQGNFNVNIAGPGPSGNLFGIHSGRTYDVKNIAAYLGFDPNRRNYFLNRKTGDQLLSGGLFVALNKVPTMQTSTNPSDPAWNQRPYEAQYLKLYDVTAPTGTPGSAIPPNAYFYGLGNSVNVSWTAAPPDSEGVTPCYQVSVTNSNPPSFVTCSTSATLFGLTGQQFPKTLTVVIQTVNPSDNSVTGPASSPVTIKLIDPNGDDDGDGMTNSAEDTAGTNPFDPNSKFQIINVSSSSVTWSAVPGRKYQLQYSNVPVGNSFNPIGPQMTAPPGSTSLSESISVTPPAYYRVQIVP